MSTHYYAAFRDHHGALFRLDTRIYLEPCSTPSGDDLCIAAIVAKNPGSARGTPTGSLAPLFLNGDKMLPTVRNRFLAAYAHAGKAIPKRAFVRVWNLFYLCNADLNAAIKMLKTMASAPNCDSESAAPPIAWFAWGNAHKHLADFKPRFQKSLPRAFFFDKHQKKIVPRVPQSEDFAKHPQGLPASPIVEFLSGHL